MAIEYPWAHAKQLRLRDEEVDPGVMETPYVSKKKKNYCKKLKGAHNFVFKERLEFKWWHSYYEISLCSGCGKKKYESFD